MFKSDFQTLSSHFAKIQKKKKRNNLVTTLWFYETIETYRFTLKSVHNLKYKYIKFKHMVKINGDIS